MPASIMYHKPHCALSNSYRDFSSSSSGFPDINSDDDSFIIGDRVWVQGCKAGHIQYIGEVKFAPGEWAGIVLDRPEGKNNGTVNGGKFALFSPPI